jgi:hypothetical protein
MKDFKEVIEDRINSYKKEIDKIEWEFKESEFPLTEFECDEMDLEIHICKHIIKELNLVLKLYINGK